MSACVHMYTCRLASKEAELQNVEKLLLGIFGVPLQEQKQLMHDMLKTMTMLQSKIVITYVFLVPVYWLPMLQQHRFMFTCLCTEAQRTTIDAWKSQFQVRSLADCYLWKYKTNRWRSRILEARKRYSSMVTCMFTVVNVCAFQHVQTEPLDSCQDMCVCPGKNVIGLNLTMQQKGCLAYSAYLHIDPSATHSFSTGLLRNKLTHYLQIPYLRSL